MSDKQYDNTNRGVLFQNNKKGNEKAPDYKGNINFNGVEKQLSGWKKKDKNGNTFLSLSISEPYNKSEEHKSEMMPTPDVGADQDLPF